MKLRRLDIYWALQLSSYGNLLEVSKQDEIRQSLFWCSREIPSWESNTLWSSAYWRCVIHKSFLHTSRPFQSFKVVAFWTRRLSDSTTRSKRKGDSGSPCRRSLWSLKGIVGEPLMRMATREVITQDLIQSLHLDGNFICTKIQSGNHRETLGFPLPHPRSFLNSGHQLPLSVHTCVSLSTYIAPYNGTKSFSLTMSI